MDWESLKYVLALGRHGTMTAAAAELGVNHSTVSRRLSSLQDELGVRLFVATPEGWDLTPAGEEMVSSTARIEAEVHELGRNLLGRDSHVAGTLRVTAVDSVFEWLGPQLVEFSRQHPGIVLEFAAHNQPINLTRREADLAIRVTNSPPETLVGRRVATVGYAAYAAASLVPDWTGPNLDDDALARLPWLSWDERLGAVVTEQWIARIAGVAAIVARYDSVPAILDHTRLGMGAACLPCYLAGPLAGTRRLTPVLDGFEIDMWLLTHPDLRHSARVRAFMDYFEAVIGEQRAALAGPTGAD